MRIIALCLITATSVACATEPQSRKTTQADFFIGQITVAAPKRMQIDLGYAHSVRELQKFALFRNDGLAWNPVGVIVVDKANSTSSRVTSLKGAQPRRGDIVLLAFSTLGHISNKRRDDNYITRRILGRYNQNGYDTGTVFLDARELAAQRRNAARWYKKADESGIRVTYGTTQAAYKSDKVKNLAAQCDLYKDLQKNAPGSVKSMSARWLQVLPIVTGYVEPVVKKPADETATEDDEFENEITKNLLPLINQEYQNDPRPLREIYAVILGSIGSSATANPRGYIRERLERSQFPQIADEPDTLNNLVEFLVSLDDE